MRTLADYFDEVPPSLDEYDVAERPWMLGIAKIPSLTQRIEKDMNGTLSQAGLDVFLRRSNLSPLSESLLWKWATEYALMLSHYASQRRVRRE